MNVWALWLVPYDLTEDLGLAGIYSSRELAQRAAGLLGVRDDGSLDIEEFTVDAPAIRRDA